MRVLNIEYNFYEKTKEIIQRVEDEQFSIDDLYCLIEEQLQIIHVSKEYRILSENLEKIRNTKVRDEIKSLLAKNCEYIRNIEENKKIEFYIFRFINSLFSHRAINFISLIGFISSFLSGVIIYNYLYSINAIDLLKYSIISSNFFIISALVFIEIFSQFLIFCLLSYLSYYIISYLSSKNKKVSCILNIKSDGAIFARISTISFFSGFLVFIFARRYDFHYVYFAHEMTFSSMILTAFFINMYFDVKFIVKDGGQGYRHEKITLFFLVLFMFSAILGVAISKGNVIFLKMEKLGFRDEFNKTYIISDDFINKSLAFEELSNINIKTYPYKKFVNPKDLPKEILNASCGKLVWNASETYVFQPKRSDKFYKIPKDKITLLQRDDIYEKCE